MDLRRVARLAGLAALAAAAPSTASAAVGDLRLVEVGRFDGPVHVTAAPGDERRLFVVERAGRVRVIRDGTTLAEPFLDISADTTTEVERGLLSIAFAPDYERSGLAYIFDTEPTGDVRIEEVRRAATDPDRADPATRRLVLRVEHSAFANHNGGLVAFGPDGLLYAGIGDGGGAGDPFSAGQNLGTLLGKIVRIDPRAAGGAPYAVPDDNPFAGRLGARPEIWAYGLRNPFRFAFDRKTGDMVIADVGQDTVEEVDFATASSGLGRGANYGWSCFEGSRAFRLLCAAPGHVPPVLERAHADGVCSITGGVVARDESLGDLAGRYLHGDLCDPVLHGASLATPKATSDLALGLEVRSLVSFGEDACGRVYAVSILGPVYRLQRGAAGLCGSPGLRLTVRRRQRLGSLRVRAGCRSACLVTVRGELLAGGRRVGALRRATVGLGVGKSATIRVAVTGRDRVAVRRALSRGERVRARLRVRANDGNGGRRDARRTVTVGR